MIILNLKSNLTLDEIKKYEKVIRKYNVIIMPSLCYLPLFNKGKYILGAQDTSEYDDLSLTGKITTKQLKSLNVKYILINHSDLNNNIKEIKNKIISVEQNGLTVLPTISNIDYNIIDLYINNINNIDYIIYEPLNNIGKECIDINKTNEEINNIYNYIKEKYNKNINIIYGGGVSINNINKLNKNDNIKGFILSSNIININNVKEICKIIK